MTDALALLAWPFAASVVLVAIHAHFGLQVLARGVVFVDLALAQVAALGATVAFMLGHPVASPATFGYSLVFTFAAALLLASLRQAPARLPQEALIGVVYVVAAAAAFLLVDKAPQGAEHIRQILTGNILTVGAPEVLALLPLYAAVGALQWAVRKPLAAARSGRARWGWDVLFYASFGVVVTSSVAIAGVLLVFAFLIVPAAIGLLFADRPARQLGIGWAVGTLASAVGLAVSYAGDLPTGAAMVCVFGAALALAGLLKVLRGAGFEAPRRAWRIGRFALGAALVASGAWLVLTPRADQPLLDLAERVVPATRAAYLWPREAAAHDDAARHAERYRLEAERLNEREARSRFEGRALDDVELGRLASFIKSYGEMQQGERFVMREVHSRARERVRWWLGGAMLLLGALALPGSAAWLAGRWPRRPTLGLNAT